MREIKLIWQCKLGIYFTHHFFTKTKFKILQKTSFLTNYINYTQKSNLIIVENALSLLSHLFMHHKVTSSHVGIILKK